MLFDNFFDFTLWPFIIKFVGALLFVGYFLLVILPLLPAGAITKPRLLPPEAAITGLSFKLAGTLLKTIELHTWQQILMFVAIFALRYALKRFFTWEKSQLQKKIH